MNLLGLLFCYCQLKMFKEELLYTYCLVRVKEARCQDYDRGITFQRVARLGVFK